MTALTEAQGPPKHYPLEAITGLRMKDLVAEPAILHGKKCVRITSSGVEQVAVIEGQTFDNGVIEAEIAGLQTSPLEKTNPRRRATRSSTRWSN